MTHGACMTHRMTSTVSVIISSHLLMKTVQSSGVAHGHRRAEEEEEEKNTTTTRLIKMSNEANIMPNVRPPK